MENFSFSNVEDLVDDLIAQKGTHLKVAFPLGLGKPTHLANALVQRLLDGGLERLEIFSALSLSPPPPGENELQKRLMEPILERLYADVPSLDYVDLRRKDQLPKGLEIHEFYYPPGALLDSIDAQRHYRSVNFTDGFRLMKDQRLDLIGQMVVPADGGYDLSCNTDLSLELYPRLLEKPTSERPLLIAQINRRLPVLGGTSVIVPETFDAVLDSDQYTHELFGMPSLPISDAQYAIGLRAACLLRDGGTVQIGIGGSGESVAWAAILRHQNPSRFAEIIDALEPTHEERAMVDAFGGIDPFKEGLFASTEMFVEGLLYMYHQGVLRREVDDGTVLHGAFYLGSPRFYEALRNLSEDDRRRLSMRSVCYTNLLHGEEEKKRAERRHARFINSAMNATLLGGLASDTLPDGRVVSGVGGQYEFIAMAHALPDARSIVMLPSTRTSGGEVKSNIVWSHGNLTIPRHLRDIVVTEYGIADLRGRSDEEVIKAMILVSDSRFQQKLLHQARDAGKIDPQWEIPPRALTNHPDTLGQALATFRHRGEIPRCPFGSALDEIELDLVQALQHLKGLSEDLHSWRLPDLSGHNLIQSLKSSSRWDDHLQRMNLLEPDSLREKALQKALIYGLKEALSSP